MPMPTYSEKYEELLQIANSAMEVADPSQTGDLWQSYLELTRAVEALTKARELLMHVSAVAFDRVMDQKTVSSRYDIS